MTVETHTGRRFDAQVHQALYPRHNVDGALYCDGEHEKSAGCRWRVIPAYTTDHDAARLIEDEIERRGLRRAYLLALDEILFSAYCRQDDYEYLELTLDEAWRFLRATPEERCRAALVAIGG